MASPGSRKARCMSTTSSAVFPGASFSAASKDSARSIGRRCAKRLTQPSARLRLRLERLTQPSARLRLRLERLTQPSARLRLRLELPRSNRERVRNVADRLDATLVVDDDGHH